MGGMYWRQTVLAVVVASAAGLGVSYATGGASSPNTTTIYGCVKHGGELRIVGGPHDCRHNESSIRWSVVGPAGPQGPTGPQGSAGSGDPSALAAEIYGPCGRDGYIESGYEASGQHRCGSGSTAEAQKVVYQQLPVGAHYYDTDPAVCSEGYKFVGGTTTGSNPDGRLFSSGGGFNADVDIPGAFDDTYVDCSNTQGCIATCMRLNFY